MGTTEWTIIATAVALFVALGSLIRFSNAGVKNELKGDIANLRTDLNGDIANLRTEIAEEYAGDCSLRTECSDMLEIG